MTWYITIFSTPWNHAYALLNGHILRKRGWLYHLFSDNETGFWWSYCVSSPRPLTSAFSTNSSLSWQSLSKFVWLNVMWKSTLSDHITFHTVKYLLWSHHCYVHNLLNLHSAFPFYQFFMSHIIKMCAHVISNFIRLILIYTVPQKNEYIFIFWTSW